MKTPFGSKPVVLVIIVSFLTTLISATPIKNTSSANTADTKITELLLLTKQIHKDMQKRMKQNSNTASISTILSSKCSSEWNNNAQISGLLADADDLESNNGLSVRGGYTTKNLEKNVNNDEGNSYVELSWDVLRSGYTEYNARANNIRRQAEIKKLEGELKKITLDYRCRKYNIANHFVGLEASLISLKLELMEPVYEVEKKSYFSGWSYLDDLLVSEQDIRLARQELKYLYTNPYWQDSLNDKTNPPVIDVDLIAIIKAIENDERYSKISQLEKKNVSEKFDYQDSSRVRLFLRKEFAKDNFNSDGVVAGVRFSVPLSTMGESSIGFKTQQIEHEAAYATWERIAKTRSAYEQLHEQLEIVVKQQYQYLKSKERIRRIKAYQSLNQELELAAVIARTRTFLDSGLKLIKAKKELYKKVNDIFLASRIEYDNRFIKVSPLESFDYRARPGERSIYLWSKRFNTMSNSQLISFLVAKDIKRVLLSAGKKTNKAKMQQFVSAAKDENIIIEAIIGSNNWLFPENHLKASAAIAAAVELNSTIHLDIEPQAIDGTKEDKLNNLNHYIDLLKEIRRISSEGIISVAVPFHWPEASYSRVSEFTNKLHVMVYGTYKADTMVRRLQKVINNVPLDKIVVVLRVSDFENEWAMEQAIEYIRSSTGISAYGFHQLDTFMKQQGQ